MAGLNTTNHPSELRVLNLQTYSKQKYVIAYWQEPKESTWRQKNALTHFEHLGADERIVVAQCNAEKASVGHLNPGR
jgi:hypothetical protein